MNHDLVQPNRVGMSMPSIRNLGALSIVLLAIGGCSSLRTTIVLPSGDVLRGSATTTINGQFYVQNARLSCYGSYEGRKVVGVGVSYGRKAVVTVRCSNGKSGTSDEPLYENGTARITFSDGTKGSIALKEE